MHRLQASRLKAEAENISARLVLCCGEDEPCSVLLGQDLSVLSGWSWELRAAEGSQPMPWRKTTAQVDTRCMGISTPAIWAAHPGSLGELQPERILPMSHDWQCHAVSAPLAQIWWQSMNTDPNLHAPYLPVSSQICATALEGEEKQTKKQTDGKAEIQKHFLCLHRLLVVPRALPGLCMHSE